MAFGLGKAKEEDQYAITTATGEVLRVIFRTGALLSHLDRYLTDSGYTAVLHKALIAVQQYIATGRDAPEAELQGAMRMLTNTIVNDPTVQLGRSEIQRRKKRQQHHGDDNNEDQALCLKNVCFCCLVFFC
jgi:hypothetical protein